MSIVTRLTHDLDGKEVMDVEVSVPVLDKQDIPIQLFVCIDTSLSMKKWAKELKTSIKTLSKQLFDSNLFNSRIKLTVISFNSDAQIVWCSDKYETTLRNHLEQLNSKIDDLCFGTNTNIFSALKLSFDIYQSSLGVRVEPMYLILMTDGDANRGPFITTTDLSLYVENRLKTLTASKINIVTIGYGSEYNIETLKALGIYYHVSNVEEMASLFGALIIELKTVYTYDARLIFSELKHNSEMFVYGSEKIGTLYSEKNCHCGLIMNPSYLDKKIYLYYTHLDGREVIEECTVIIEEHTTDTISNVYLSYYKHLYDQLTHKIYKHIYQPSLLNEVCKSVIKDVTCWSISESKEFQTKLVSLCSIILEAKDKPSINISTLALSACGELCLLTQTPGVQKSAQYARDLFRSFL